MIHKIGIKATLLDFVDGKVAGQLMQNSADYFHVSELFRAYLVKSQVPKSKNVVISGLSGYSAKSLCLKFKEFGQIQNAHAM